MTLGTITLKESVEIKGRTADEQPGFIREHVIPLFALPVTIDHSIEDALIPVSKFEIDYAAPFPPVERHWSGTAIYLDGTTQSFEVMTSHGELNINPPGSGVREGRKALPGGELNEGPVAQQHDWVWTPTYE